MCTKFRIFISVIVNTGIEIPHPWPFLCISIRVCVPCKQELLSIANLGGGLCFRNKSQRGLNVCLRRAHTVESLHL